MSEEAPSISPAAHTAAGLDQAFSQLAEAGGWWTGAQRIAIAEEARAARKCALCAERKTALSPYSVSGQDHDKATTLSSHTIDIIHRITSDPGRLSQRWYDEAMAGGMRAVTSATRAATTTRGRASPTASFRYPNRSRLGSHGRTRKCRRRSQIDV